MKHIIALAACLLALPAAAAQDSYAKRPEVRAFIRDLAERHGFAERELAGLFAKVRRAEPVLESIKPLPPKARSWDEYRGIFVNERRVAAGMEFWKAHRETLERAEREYGVPAEYILAIMGVETFYGRNMGRWRVVDALSTLAFDYPPRADFFRKELENYLLLAREGKLDVFSVRGSYAGAMGIPQFMPSSTRRYAVDFDGDGAVDLRGNVADAAGSIGNFLKEHGWQAGSAVLLEAQVAGEAWRPLADGTVDAKHRLALLQQSGVQLAGPAQEENALASLIELQSPERGASEFRVGLRNFYVLTRYNRSAFYATAVHDLAQALKKAQEAGR